MKKIYRQNSNLVIDQSGASLGFFIEKLFYSKISNINHYKSLEFCQLGFRIEV